MSGKLSCPIAFKIKFRIILNKANTLLIDFKASILFIIMRLRPQMV